MDTALTKEMLISIRLRTPELPLALFFADSEDIGKTMKTMGLFFYMLVRVTTTGLSVKEKSLIRKRFIGTKYVLEESMSCKTLYLLTYRSIFTEKRVLADKWGIPLINVEWAYKSLCEKSILSYRIRKYEGCLFSTTGVTNLVFVNYFRLLGGWYAPVLSRSHDFLVARDRDRKSAKTEYASECGISVIPADDIFFNRSVRNRMQYSAEQGEEKAKDEIFNGMVFCFKGSSEIHTLVRKVIIEHGGSRVEKEAGDREYHIYFGGRSKQKNLIRYQWVLDSAEMGVLLCVDPYKVVEIEVVPLPLKNTVILLMVGNEEVIKCKNKVEALGGEAVLEISSRVTHCIVETSRSAYARKRAALGMYKVHVCTIDWLDQCIYHMKRVKERADKEESAPVVVTVEKRPKRILLGRKTDLLYGWTVQFTGLVSDLRVEAAETLRAYGAVVADEISYTEKCTHLVVGTVSVSLKFLSAVAAGTTLLDYSAIDALKKGRYTHESNYSLDKRFLSVDVGKNEKIVRQLICAAPEWRKRREKTGEKAFSGWRVLVAVEKEKENIEQLIINGGGEIVRDPDLNQEDKKEDKNILIYTKKDNKRCNNTPITQNKCIQMAYILKYLARME